ncbi:concanavalin A-like lectin/glucanase domain-containing protein [Leucosporidium creatinivorum]|uniref:Concanavalin A-like lectin/glucanase domain-containing protein n=1 Tax=Leucosporidium creatinivorum TaxID=106004 RepID=A0A1Y2FA93_9BASI|nr:concanavalin A-like lectin/glucanase domain-containing protein [Leucosporidium creatinivorum]
MVSRPSGALCTGAAVALSASLLCLIASNAPAVNAAEIPSQGGTNVSTEACGWNYLCPSSAPCCSNSGFCSSGVACLAGCDPLGSTNTSYCAPQPVCQTSNYTFTDDSRLNYNVSGYNGDADKWDWTVDTWDSSNTSLIQNGELILPLTETGGGTKLSSTRAFLYGNVQASIKMVGQVGVVTAFITMSGVKDEIDWESTGSDTDEAQTNYYWEGDVNNYKNGGSATAKNSDSTYHVYGFDWTPDQLEWTIDGKTVRTLTRDSTKNGSLYKYPQTPSRIQMSVWPAGIAGASQGTIDWAGGMIDWTTSTYKSQGYYAAHVQWINVECYDDSSSNSSRLARRDDETLWERSLLWERAGAVNSYVWGSNDTNGQIQVSSSDSATIINSPYSTGLNMLISNGDTKGVTKSSGSSSLANTAVGNWWSKLGTAAKVGICIGAAAVFLFTLVALCTCIARSKDKKKKRYAAVNDDNAAIPLTAAGAAATKSNRLAPQASSASLASSIQKPRYDDSPQYEYTQQQAYALGQQRQQEQYYPQQQRYAPQQQQYAPQQYYAAHPPPGQFGYPQQQGWQGQGRY